MEVVHLFPDSFGANCYLLEDSGEAWIVDPSVSAASILKRLREDGCEPLGILLTHGHFDHIISIDTLRSALPALKVYLHPADAPMLTDGNKSAFTTFFGQDRVYREADAILEDGQELPVGQAKLTVLHTPGHSEGSVCFLEPDARVLITGDTLFANGYGRCDLWGGDARAIRQSLDRLRELKGRYLTIYPGHGDTAPLDRALEHVRYL